MKLVPCTSTWMTPIQSFWGSLQKNLRRRKKLKYILFNEPTEELLIIFPLGPYLNVSISKLKICGNPSLIHYFL